MNDLFSFMATHSGLATITLRLPYNHEKSAPLHENCSNGGGMTIISDYISRNYAINHKFGDLIIVPTI